MVTQRTGNLFHCAVITPVVTQKNIILIAVVFQHCSRHQPASGTDGTLDVRFMSWCRRWGGPITSTASGAGVCWHPLTSRSPALLEQVAEPLGVSVLHRQ